VADIIDQGFLCHRSITQLWTEIARNLTESVILPMDVQWYASYLKEAFGDIKSRYEKQLEANKSTLSNLKMLHFIALIIPNGKYLYNRIFRCRC